MICYTKETPGAKDEFRTAHLLHLLWTITQFNNGNNIIDKTDKSFYLQMPPK